MTMWLSLGAHDSKLAAQISEENHKLECVLTLVWPDCLGGGRGGMTALISLGFESLWAPLP